MKCPFRTIVSYFRTVREKVNNSGATGMGHWVDTIKPCTESEAQTKIEDFADCYGLDCGAFDRNGLDRCRKFTNPN